MLEIVNVHKNFKTKNGVTNALQEVNLSVKNGDFVVLVGPSGCGKSTLLNIIAGLEKATSGQVSKSGRPILDAGPDRMVMFQEAALFPWLKVIDNVEYGMKIKGTGKRERREKAIHYLKMVHLTRFASAYPHELSVGMRQRVALARALSMDSDMLLMDEPFAALDSQTKSILHAELQQIWGATKKTIIFVTHNVEEAVLLADRVIVMTANPGRIKKEFRVQLARPRNIEDIDLTSTVGQILGELKEEVEKVAKAELDSDWSLENSSFISRPDTHLGNGI
ncbi:MAG: Bicarbonate transport ATP-binding protein CmpD [Syntrophomonadaceae bacterium]|nr:Bicarbonate transport ATP-binding protein CmpD [Bacillota bacterium]